MNEKYKFTIDKLVSIKEIIKNIEETNYIDGYLGYENDFYIDSILYYLKENARLKDKIEKAVDHIKNIDKYEETLNDDTRVYMVQDVDVDEIERILKEN